jgi:hypothetical protein
MKCLYETNRDTRLVGNLACTASRSSKETKPGRGGFDENDLCKSGLSLKGMDTYHYSSHREIGVYGEDATRQVRDKYTDLM